MTISEGATVQSEPTTDLTRRRLLQTGGVALGMALGARVVWAAPAAAQDSAAAVLRARWRSLLTGGDGYDASVPAVRAALDRIDGLAGQHLDTLNRGAGRTFLWPDLSFAGTPFEQSVDIRLTYDRIQQMATAYATSGSSLHRDPGVLADLIDALEWMNTRKYNDGPGGGYGNWYNWQIGAPLALNATSMMLYDELGPDRVSRYAAAVDRWIPGPYGTGANRVWFCTAVAGRAALVGDDQKLAVARDGISPVLSYVTSGDGFYEDGSFIQHGRHPYTGGYGLSLLANLTRLLYLFDGSPWQVTDPNIANVVAWVRKGYEPWLHKGSLLSPVRGREISRHTRQDHQAGHDATRAILWLSEIFPPSARELKGLVKHTLRTDSFRDYYRYEPATTDSPGNDVSSILAALTLADDPTVPARSPAAGATVYPMMDRFVHHGDGFAFATSMSSARIFSYESINDENLRGWYTGNGAHYLYNDDLGHYDDDYWATVDHHRLPGTTVPVGPRADGAGASYLSPKRWAGGAALDTLGVAGMEFQTFGPFDRCRLRIECDGEAVTFAWSPDGTRYVRLGQPASIAGLAGPHVGMYAANGITNAPSTEARFESFQVWCDDDSAGQCAQASDEFDGDALDRDRWTRIVREAPDRYRVSDGSLVLLTDRGEFDRGADSTRNIVLQRMPPGAWRIDAVLRFVPQANYHHAGLVVYQDDRNFVRIHRVMAAGGDRFDFVEQRDGVRRQLVTSFPQNEFTSEDLSSAPRGKKSWFTFGDKIAVLGAGIASSNGEPVETIVENRRLLRPSDQRFVVNGRERALDTAWSDTIDDAAWAHLGGASRGGGIGYVFPRPTTVQALRDARVGRWSDVNQAAAFADDGAVRADYLTLWVDHGTDPEDAAYAYVMLPGASERAVMDFARDPGIEVLRNDSDVQAVRSGGSFGANFWRAGPTTVSGVTCEGAASVLVSQQGSRIGLAVADPTHVATGTVRLTVRRAAARVTARDPRVTVESLRPWIRLAVDVSGARGGSIRASFDAST